MLQFGSTSVENGSFVPVATAQEEPHLAFLADSKTLYTIVFFDKDAPYPSDPYLSPYLHYLVVDAQGGNIANGKAMIDYMPPNPPKDSEPHTYYFSIYRQLGSSTAHQHKRRENFPLDAFVAEQNLMLVDAIYFRSGYIPDPAPAMKTDRRTMAGTTGGRTMAARAAAVAPMVARTVAVAPATKRTIAGRSMVGAMEGRTFVDGNPLSEKEQAFCKCVLVVASKQPGSCDLEHAWFQERNGATCYNPYAVCAARVGTSSRQCDLYYDYNSLSDAELIAFANLNNVSIPDPFDRNNVLEGISARVQQKWNEKKY